MKFATPRTYLREFAPADAAAVLTFNSNQQVTKFTGDAGLITSLADAQKVIHDVWLHEYRTYGYGRWAVVDKQTDKVIGFCGFKYLPHVDMPDIGYRFLPEYWGRGLASETAIACVEYGKTQLHIRRYFADVMPENIASVKVIKKLGLKFHGLIDEDGHTFMRFKQGARTMLNINQFYK